MIIEFPSFSDSAAINADRIHSLEPLGVIRSLIRFVRPIFGANVVNVCSEWVFFMMSAYCSVVVTLSRVSRPCRTQCCSAKCLISTCFNRAGPKRVAMPMQTEASSFNRAVTVYSNSTKYSQATRGHTHKQLPSKIRFLLCSSLLVSVFETNLARTLLQASTDYR